MMNADFLDALGQIEKEKDIPRDHLLEMIGQALCSAESSKRMNKNGQSQGR